VSKETANAKLGPVSYLILGLLAKRGKLTPYDMKKQVEGTLGAIWSFPHAQLYTEPARLVDFGLLTESRELEGRRRRTFTLTARGRKSLKNWLSDLAVKSPEIRNLAWLKLFFAEVMSTSDKIKLSSTQIEMHQSVLGILKVQSEQAQGEGEAALIALGISINQAYIDFWQRLAKGLR